MIVKDAPLVPLLSAPITCRSGLYPRQGAWPNYASVDRLVSATAQHGQRNRLPRGVEGWVSLGSTATLAVQSTEKPPVHQYSNKTTIQIKTSRQIPSRTVYMNEVGLMVVSLGTDVELWTGLLQPLDQVLPAGAQSISCAQREDGRNPRPCAAAPLPLPVRTPEPLTRTCLTYLLQARVGSVTKNPRWHSTALSPP